MNAFPKRARGRVLLICLCVRICGGFPHQFLRGLRDRVQQLGRPSRVLELTQSCTHQCSPAFRRTSKDFFGRDAQHLVVDIARGSSIYALLGGFANLDVIISDVSLAAPRHMDAFDRLFSLLRPDGGIYAAIASSNRTVLRQHQLVRLGCGLAECLHGLRKNCTHRSFIVTISRNAVVVERNAVADGIREVFYGQADPNFPFYSYGPGGNERQVKEWSDKHQHLLRAPSSSERGESLKESSQSLSACAPCGCTPNPLLRWASEYRGPLLWKWDGCFDSYHYALCDLHLQSQAGARPFKVLELGVNTGGSIAMWRRYLGRHTEYYGVDKNQACSQFEKPDENVKIHIGSQSDKQLLDDIVRQHGKFDLISDDASHVSHLTLESLKILLPALAARGVYLIEDLASQLGVVIHVLDLTQTYLEQGFRVTHFKNIISISRCSGERADCLQF